jgi:cysteine synthase A
MPDKMSQEKVTNLRAFGAKVVMCPTAVDADDPRSYYKVSRRIADETPNSFYANQYHNPANPEAHYISSGPEIWRQTKGDFDVFVAGMGTGGTIGGTTRFLKERRPAASCYLVDCEGSSLFNHVTRGTLDAAGSSILEGIGIRRITHNFAQAKLDGAFVGTDRESVEMVHWLLARDGLFLGGSAALNCVGAVKLARKLGPGHTIVTILCDGAGRYASRLFSPTWLAEKGLTPTAKDLSFVA